MRPAPVTPPDLKQRLARLAWNCVHLMLFRPSPVVFHGWRRMLLRGFGAKVGPGAHPYPSAKIWAPWNLILSRDACLGPDSEIYNVDIVTLGQSAIVSQKAYLCTASHTTDRHFTLIGAPITLGDKSWVGARAQINPGVTIGTGGVAGAGSVVTKDIAAHVIVAGNPARPVGHSNLAQDRQGEPTPVP